MTKSVHTDTWIGAFVIVLSVFLFVQTFDMPELAATFPQLMIGVLGAFGCLLFLLGIRKTIKADCNGDCADFSKAKYSIIFYLLILTYVIGICYVGYFVSTAAFIAGSMFFFKYKNYISLCLTVCGMLMFIYFLFVRQLGVILPETLLF